MSRAVPGVIAAGAIYSLLLSGIILLGPGPNSIGTVFGAVFIGVIVSAVSVLISAAIIFLFNPLATVRIATHGDHILDRVDTCHREPISGQGRICDRGSDLDRHQWHHLRPVSHILVGQEKSKTQNESQNESQRKGRNKIESLNGSLSPNRASSDQLHRKWQMSPS